MLDLHQAARLLDVRPETLARWVRQGLLTPADTATPRFESEELVRWARSRGLSLAGEGKHRWQPGQDLLADAIDRGAYAGEVVADSASGAIAGALAALPDLSDAARASLLDEVLQRERMASTALGHGVALPHPRKPPAALFQKPVVCVLYPATPVDWAALDGEPVHTVLLLLSPSAPIHLEILSRVAFALRTPGFPAFLRARPARDELCAKLRDLRKEG